MTVNLLESRRSLPGSMSDRSSFSIWSVIKQSIGKDLTKFSIPVIWNEPLSFLQRLAENFEYSPLLDKACLADDYLSPERFHYITAFVISTMSINIERLSKPFNPLLGETYELETSDFHYISEQVSHHPPISAFYAKGKQWELSATVQPKIKFHGTSVEAVPEGSWILKIKKKSSPTPSLLTVPTTTTTTEIKHSNSNGSFHSCAESVNSDEQEDLSGFDIYTWHSPSLTVHNIIFGKLWCEFHGTVDIKHETSKMRSCIQIKSYSWFNSQSKNDMYKFDGSIFKGKEKLSAFHGSYGHCYYVIDDLNDLQQRQVSKKCDAGGDSVILLNSNNLSSSSSICDLSLLKSSRLLWVRNLKMSPDELNQRSKYYYFTRFALCLNEEIPKSIELLPETDSRFRQDVRELELGNLDSASAEKHRLEEKKQRAAKRETGDNRHKPLWFDSIESNGASEQIFNFNGDYFKRDFKNCPNLF